MCRLMQYLCRFESKVCAGSRFFFAVPYLPAVQDPADASPSSPDEPPKVSASTVLRAPQHTKPPISVVLVDDNAMMLKSLERLLLIHPVAVHRDVLSVPVWLSVLSAHGSLPCFRGWTCRSRASSATGKN